MTGDRVAEIKADLETGRDISSDQQRWLVGEVEEWRQAAEAEADLADERLREIDRLRAEVEQLRDRVFELKIYEGFGQDHGHQRCVAVMARLSKENERLRVLAGEASAREILGLPDD